MAKATEMEPVPAYFPAIRLLRRGAAPVDRKIALRQRIARRFRRRCFGIAGDADRASVIGRLFVGLVGLVGDDLIQLARAVLRALADHGCGLAADFAGGRLALAELAHVRHRRGRRRLGF